MRKINKIQFLCTILFQLKCRFISSFPNPLVCIIIHKSSQIEILQAWGWIPWAIKIYTIAVNKILHKAEKLITLTHRFTMWISSMNCNALNKLNFLKFQNFKSKVCYFHCFYTHSKNSTSQILIVINLQWVTELLHSEVSSKHCKGLESNYFFCSEHSFYFYFFFILLPKNTTWTQPPFLPVHHSSISFQKRPGLPCISTQQGITRHNKTRHKPSYQALMRQHRREESIKIS